MPRAAGRRRERHGSARRARISSGTTKRHGRSRPTRRTTFSVEARAVVAQAPVGHPLQGVAVAGEPADGVEGLRERQHALSRDEAVGRAQPPEPLVRRGHADRTGGVGGEADVGVAEGDSGGRSARRAAGQRAGHRAVGRGAVVRVVAGDAVGELVGAGDAAQRRAAAQQVARRPGAVASRAAPRRGTSGCPRRCGSPRWRRGLSPRRSSLERTLPAPCKSGSPTMRQTVRSSAGVRGVTCAAVMSQRPSMRCHTWVCWPGPPPGKRVTEHEQRGIRRPSGAVLDRTISRGGAPPRSPERADRVMADEQARRVAAQRVGSGGEDRVERVEVVRHERALVRVEGVAQVGGDRRGVARTPAVVRGSGRRAPRRSAPVGRTCPRSRPRGCARARPHEVDDLRDVEVGRGAQVGVGQVLVHAPAAWSSAIAARTHARIASSRSGSMPVGTRYSGVSTSGPATSPNAAQRVGARDDLEAQRGPQRRLERGQRDLAVALREVRVADVGERARRPAPAGRASCPRRAG